METRHMHGTGYAEDAEIVLKRDTLGAVYLDRRNDRVIRRTSAAAPWARPLARRLARREAKALQRLAGQLACPALIEATRERVVRRFLPGKPLYAADFDPQRYFRDALRQLRRMHACGVVHNDLAKEANWICMPHNRAGIVDFQVALIFPRRGRLFRTLAREDLRHLLKHKAHYAAESLSARQRAILARPLWPTRVWRSCFKPVYNFLTRRILGWPERNSAVERTV